MPWVQDRSQEAAPGTPFEDRGTTIEPVVVATPMGFMRSAPCTGMIVATGSGGVNGARRMDHESCVACDFDGSLFDARQLLDAIRALGPEWSTLLSNAGDDLRVRPAPETWSAIEYAAHSRDITALHVFGVDQALRLDEPVIPEIAADELIEEASATYATADPGLVASELGDQARLLADLAEAAGPASWTRGITIGDSRRDVRSLLEHALHDSHHHLVDVEDGLSVLRARTR